MEGHTPLVSIIIPTYNSENTMGSLLRSIKKTTLEDYEIIVVDDVSKDSTLTLCNKIGVHQIIQLDMHSGPSRARNIGASHAQGDILIFMDSDILLPQDDDIIFKINEVFDNNAGIDCVATISDIHPIKLNAIAYNNSIYHNYYVNKLLNGEKSISKPMMFFPSRFAGIRKEKFRASGGFHESLKTVMNEDGVFWTHCYYLNYKTYLDKDLTHFHLYPTDFKRFVKSVFLASMVQYFIDTKWDTSPDACLKPKEKGRRLFSVVLLFSPLLLLFIPPFTFLYLFIIAIVIFFFSFGTMNQLIWKYVSKRYLIQWYIVYIAITPFILGGYSFGIFRYLCGVRLLAGKPSTLPFFNGA